MNDLAAAHARLLDLARAAPSPQGPASLSRLRLAAAEAFALAGLPTSRHEEWKYTSLMGLASLGFEPEPWKQKSAACVAEADAMRRMTVPPGFRRRWGRIERLRLGAAGVCEVVMAAGRVVRSRSDLRSRDAGLSVLPLADADPGLVEAHLGAHAGVEAQPFAALNSAVFEDALVIRATGSDLPAVHLMSVGAAGGRVALACPRVLLVAEPGSRVVLIETYASGRGLMCPLTEVVAGAGARVDVYRVILDHDEAHHVGTLRIEQAAASRVRAFVAPLRGRLTRSNIHARLSGPDGECTINGLCMPRGERLVDAFLRVEHAARDCRSWEFFRAAVEGRARSVFTGRIYVHPGADGTDAKQTSANLLLSPEARAEARPQLEIFADDVKCTHAATVGELDEGAMFYLRARGLAPERARAMLVRAFAGESLAQVGFIPLRRWLRRRYFAGRGSGGGDR